MAVWPSHRDGTRYISLYKSSSNSLKEHLVHSDSQADTSDSKYYVPLQQPKTFRHFRVDQSYIGTLPAILAGSALHIRRPDPTLLEHVSYLRGPGSSYKSFATPG